MQFSMTGQEKGDLLIQVTTWAGLTVHNKSHNGETQYFFKNSMHTFL